MSASPHMLMGKRVGSSSEEETIIVAAPVDPHQTFLYDGDMIAYVIYFLVFVAGVALVNRGIKDQDTIDIWFGIVFIVGMFTISIHSIKEQLKPEPIQIVEKQCEGDPIIYDFGVIGIKAFQDDDGTVFVVSCFQGEGDTTTNCWDKRFDKDDE